MGGIGVALSRDGPPDPDAVQDMLEAVPHRGSRTEFETLGRVVVGVCRDADRGAATLARRGGRVGAFHGTLDNDADLRSALRAEGVEVRSAEPPAATVLAATSQWGEDALSRLRGSFAGVLTDGRSVRCFRDHFGTRPLFYHDGAAGFFAGTEAKQVVAGASLGREPDLDHIRRLLFGVVERTTAYRNVGRHLPRRVERAGREPGLRVRQYWEPEAFVETADLDVEEAAARTLTILDEAVSRTLTGEDAILLSGGLDSPALAAVAARGSRPSERIEGVTAVYPEHPSTDEREWTEIAAEALGIQLHAYEAEAASLDEVGRWMRALDGPFTVFSIPESAEAYEAARACGARTVLTGELAEVLFDNRYHLLDHLLSHGRLRAVKRELARLRENGAGRLDLARRVARALAPGVLVDALGKRGGRRREYPPWVDAGVAAEFRDADGSTPGPRRRWTRAQTAPFQGVGVGFEVDEICAAHSGVTVRRPFADVDLWEFALSLPAEVKFPGPRSKPLLRRAMRGLLPAELIDRRDKTYFDEFHLATADYDTLRRLLVDPSRRLEGIDYATLADRIEAADMGVYELQWARNVARAHAFLEQL